MKTQTMMKTEMRTKTRKKKVFMVEEYTICYNYMVLLEIIFNKIDDFFETLNTFTIVTIIGQISLDKYINIKR